MTETAKPGPFELWQQAGGDGARYRELMREHGHLLSPGDEGYDETSRNLPCGWPGKRGTILRDEVLEAEVRDQYRDLGLDEDSTAEALSAARDAGMFDVRDRAS